VEVDLEIAANKFQDRPQLSQLLLSYWDAEQELGAMCQPDLKYDQPSLLNRFNNME